MTEIKNAAFAHLDSLEDVKLSNSLISMGVSAFWDAKNLHELIIPDTLETSGDTPQKQSMKNLSASISLSP